MKKRREVGIDVQLTLSKDEVTLAKVTFEDRCRTPRAWLRSSRAAASLASDENLLRD